MGSPQDFARKKRRRKLQREYLKATRKSRLVRQKKTRMVVYKVGGSLLEFPELFTQLSELLRARPMERPLITFGGGEAANLVRKWDEQFNLTQEESHELAVRAMDLNAELGERKIQGAAWALNRKDVKEIWREGGVPVLDIETYLEENEPGSTLKLPHTWDCTSDAIAAWCAIRLHFNELRFLKSVPAPNFEELMDPSVEILDPVVREFFPQIPLISWCNLRESLDVVTIK